MISPNNEVSRFTSDRMTAAPELLANVLRIRLIKLSKSGSLLASIVAPLASAVFPETVVWINVTDQKLFLVEVARADPVGA